MAVNSYDILITKYLNDELNPQEEATFQHLLVNDPKLAAMLAEAQQQRLAEEEGKEIPESPLVQMEDDDKRAIRESSPSLGHLTWRWFKRFAAIFLVGLLAFEVYWYIIVPMQNDALNDNKKAAKVVRVGDGNTTPADLMSDFSEVHNVAESSTDEDADRHKNTKKNANKTLKVVELDAFKKDNDSYSDSSSSASSAPKTSVIGEGNSNDSWNDPNRSANSKNNPGMDDPYYNTPPNGGNSGGNAASNTNNNGRSQTDVVSLAPKTSPLVTNAPSSISQNNDGASSSNSARSSTVAPLSQNSGNASTNRNNNNSNDRNRPSSSETNNNQRKHPSKKTSLPSSSQVKWLTLEQALQKHQSQPKKIFIDLHTDWSMRMKAAIYDQPEIAKLLNDHFYAAQFNGETTKTINYRKKAFNFAPDKGSNGLHELALYFTKDKVQFPALIFIDEYLHTPYDVLGLQSPEALRLLLKYYGQDYDKEMNWTIFKKLHRTPAPPPERKRKIPKEKPTPVEVPPLPPTSHEEVVAQEVLSSELNSERYLDLQKKADRFLTKQFPSPPKRKKKNEEKDQELSDKISDGWELAIKAYQEKNYTVAALAIESIASKGDATAEHYLYLGLSYLYQQPSGLQAALRNFNESQNIDQKEQQKYNNEINWFKALIYIKSDQLDKAEPLLEQLAGTRGKRKRRAKQFLKMMREKE